jgi:hypothetical protein
MVDREELPLIIRWNSSRKIVVVYSNGVPRLAEDVKEMRQSKRDLIFVRCYPGGRKAV